MIDERIIDKLVERLVERIEEGNSYVLEKIGESIKKVGTFSPSKAQQLAQVLKYGGNYNKIAEKLAKITELNVKDIYAIFEEVAKNDYLFAEQFYNYRGVKYIPYEENIALQQQVKALAKITADEYVNLTKTSAVAFGWQDKNGTITYKGLKKTYQDLLDEAVLNVAQGKETFDEAMYRQLKKIGGGGIKVIFPSTYVSKDEKGNEVLKNRVMRADSAVRMQIKSALRNLHNETQAIFGEEFGSDGVEISVHINPAPDHAEVQGRQFSKEEFAKFQNDQDAVDYTGKVFEPEHDGHDRRSISEYNCYHYTFDIVLGVSKPEYSEEELQQIIDDNNKGFEYEGNHYSLYDGEQLLRKIELELRKSKDMQIMGRASGNKQIVEESQTRITQLTNKYRDVLKASGLKSKLERARVQNYHRVNVEKMK